MFVIEGKKYLCTLWDTKCSIPALPWIAKPGGLFTMDRPSVRLESNEVV